MKITNLVNSFNTQIHVEMITQLLYSVFSFKTRLVKRTNAIFFRSLLFFQPIDIIKLNSPEPKLSCPGITYFVQTCETSATYVF